jgi:hypothetical protein
MKIGFKLFFKDKWIGFVLMLAITTIIPISMICSKDYLDALYMFIGLLIASILVISIGYYSWKSIMNEYINNYNKEQAKQDELYSNMTFDKFINIVYENEIIDLDHIGCPEGLTEEQEKEFIKEYITKLKENDEQ